MVWRGVGLRAAAADLLDLPRLDSRQLCRLDASREDVVHAQVRTELNVFLIVNRSQVQYRQIPHADTSAARRVPK
jgi:hypothetical protein